jgi:ribosomal protein L11 methyltransferase
VTTETPEDLAESPTKDWHAFCLSVPAAMADDIAAEFFDLGSCGVHLEEAGQAVRLNVYFPGELEKALLAGQIHALLSQAGLAVALPEAERVEDQDWNTQWQRFFKPVWISPNLVVCPSWIPLDLQPGQIAIVIDPKRAFGTGGHESTQLALRALIQIIRPQERCLDLGTGSGILTIAALKLGAAGVDAVDIDIDAVENALENLMTNGVAEKAQVRQGSLAQVETQKYGLVLANILYTVLVPMLKGIHAVLEQGGHVVFSGLLVKDQKPFCRAAQEAGLRTIDTLEQNEWLCVVAQRDQ